MPNLVAVATLEVAVWIVSTPALRALIAALIIPVTVSPLIVLVALIALIALIAAGVIILVAAEPCDVSPHAAVVALPLRLLTVCCQTDLAVLTCLLLVV